MMGKQDHIPRQQLEQFVKGQMNETESEQVMSHLGQCDHCLALTDELWNEQPVSRAMSEIVDLDDRTAERMQRKVTSQIHRSNLSGNMIRLGTQGFLSVALGLLRPLVGQQRNRTRGAYDD
jgi:anti-sigma factor RsiW